MITGRFIGSTVAEKKFLASIDLTEHQEG